MSGKKKKKGEWLEEGIERGLTKGPFSSIKQLMVLGL